MIAKPAYKVEPGSFEKWVYDNAQGKVITLSAAPTTAGAEVPEGTIGYFSNALYWTIGGVTYQLGMIPT